MAFEIESKFCCSQFRFQKGVNFLLKSIRKQDVFLFIVLVMPFLTNFFFLFVFSGLNHTGWLFVNPAFWLNSGEINAWGSWIWPLFSLHLFFYCLAIVVFISRSQTVLAFFSFVDSTKDSSPRNYQRCQKLLKISFFVPFLHFGMEILEARPFEQEGKLI